LELTLNEQTVDIQAQTAMKRKWVQWKSAWGKTGWGKTPVISNHFSSHTNSSIAETSRAAVSLEHPATASSFQQKENCHLLSTLQQKANEQEKTSKACANGKEEILNMLETTAI